MKPPSISLHEISDEGQLEDVLSTPYPEDVDFARTLEGDILILGAGGKMGPTLVRRIVRSVAAAASETKVYAASRFTDESSQRKLTACGAVSISVDLLDTANLETLPDCPNIIYMVGRKFGAVGNEPLTWATNTYLAARIARHFRSSRIVSFSTGNVYPLAPVDSGGSKEEDPVAPIGEYAQSCLGRERVLQYFAKHQSTPMCILRLNYALEARYGVLLDIALRVASAEPVSVDTGYVNVIWQGDANSVCFRSLGQCKAPAEVLNVAGPETLSVRDLALQFGQRLGRPPIFRGKETGTAFLSNAERCHQLFRVPRVSIDGLLDLICHWIEVGGPVLDKPTKFDVRDGSY